MTKDTDFGAYRIRLTLEESDPPVVREIAVPDFASLFDIHNSIQSCFGWMDYHMHVFCSDEEEYSIPPFDLKDAIDETTVPISEFEGCELYYNYDFGDNWQIQIEILEKMDYDFEWSRLLSWENNGPPEDCGGIYRFNEIMKSMSDPNNEEVKEFRAHYGDWEFDEEMVSNDLQACMPQGVRDPEDTEILPAIIPMLLLMPLLSGLKKKLVVDEATGIPYMVESSKRKSKRRNSEIFIQQSDIDKDPDRYLLITEDASSIPIDVGKRFLEKYKLPVPETDDTLEFLNQAHESVGKAGLEKEWSECIPGGLLRFVYDWAEENGFFFMNECDDDNPAESFFKKLHQQPEFENEEELMRFIEEHNNSLK